MKDLVDEIDSRIKSPFLGYLLFSAVVINWESLFYLMIHNGTVADRIDYFNERTDLLSLFLLPFLLAAAYSIFYPWLQYGFTFLSRKPTELKNAIQAQSESHLLMKKKELERARSELLEVAEKELIRRAERDAELEKIEDEDIRIKLQAEINDLRKERDNLRGSTSSAKENMSTLNSEQEEIIRLITSKDGAMDKTQLIRESRFEKIKTEYYLDILEENGYLVKDYEGYPDYARNGYRYSLTTMSRKIMIEKGFVK